MSSENLQPVPITTDVVSSNLDQGVQHYVIKLVSDLRKVGGFLRVLLFPPPMFEMKMWIHVPQHKATMYTCQPVTAAIFVYVTLCKIKIFCHLHGIL
jgi:hypothetical protein